MLEVTVRVLCNRVGPGQPYTKPYSKPYKQVMVRYTYKQTYTTELSPSCIFKCNRYVIGQSYTKPYKQAYITPLSPSCIFKVRPLCFSLQTYYGTFTGKTYCS